MGLKMQSLDTREWAKALTTPSRCEMNWAHTASVNPNNPNNAMNFNVDSSGNVNSNNDNRNNNNDVRCVGR